MILNLKKRESQVVLSLNIRKLIHFNKLPSRSAFLNYSLQKSDIAPHLLSVFTKLPIYLSKNLNISIVPFSPSSNTSQTFSASSGMIVRQFDDPLFVHENAS